ncbi:MAG: nucleotidyltransferase domain-containing protein [Saprospiraceae bacterium]|nr:nucleotidyltransferase domain-containing protein [Saprospiraceae bacterium]
MNHHDNTISQAVKSAVREFDPAASVVLFGSRARGDARADSDYDFLVLLKKPFDFRLKSQILDRLYEVELANNCVLGVMVENADYWQMLENTPIFSEIQKDGVAV